MSEKHLEPAKTIIGRFGDGKAGVDKVSDITGKHVSRVYRWMYPKDRGGTGGLIPQGDCALLLAHAQQNGISLTPADFFPSVEAAE